MKRCWIHIGMHKTSSTSLQQNLSQINGGSEWCLLSVGGRPNMGPALHAMFINDSNKCTWFRKRGWTSKKIARKAEAWRSELQKTISSYQGEVCIISSEYLTDNVFGEDAVASLRDFLKPLFDEVLVFGYVRPPAQYKNSRFQERIKHRRHDFGTEEINYRRKFEKFDNVFGASSVFLRKFDPATFPDHCAVTDFCRQIGIRLPEGSEIKRFNEGLNRHACGILYAYRKFGPDYGKGRKSIMENKCLIGALQKMRGEKLIFASSVLSPALQREKNDIAWMEQRLGASLDDKYCDTGNEVSCEDDLLRIPRSACLEFIKAFEDMLGLCILPSLHPKKDPVEPIEVAALLQNCRKIFRKIRKQRMEIPPPPVTWRRLIARRFRRIQRFVSKRLTRSAGGGVSSPVTRTSGTSP